LLLSIMPPKKQVINGDDSINFKELGRCVNSQLQKDAKYDRENDAKFRAIRQRVATYEEFENIVIGAHLKPMKDDVANLNLKNGSWDSSTGRAKQRSKHRLNQHTDDKNDEVDTGLAAPSTVQDFGRVWNKLKTPSDKYKYLVHVVGCAMIKKLYKSGIDSVLGSFIDTLHTGYVNEDKTVILDLLETFSQTSRFALTINFLEDAERTKVEDLFQKLEVSDIDETLTQKLEQLRSAYM